MVLGAFVVAGILLPLLRSWTVLNMIVVPALRARLFRPAR